MSTIELQTSTNENFTQYSKDEYSSFDNAWQEILGFIDYGDRFKRNVIRLGVCVPEACTAADLETSLQREMDRILLPHQLKARIEVHPNLCSTDKDLQPFEIGYYITGGLIGLLLLAVSLSTTYHLIVLVRDTQDNKTCLEVITIFSAIRNGRDLIKYNRNNDLNIYNGLKVTILMVVLFTHKYTYFVINPILYPKLVEEVYTVGPHFPLTIANIVDPFFFITGYLVYIMMIPQFTKPGCQWFHIPFVIVYKYLRTLPIYIILMLLTTFVIPHLGDGPFWANKMWLEADKCKTHWWTNLLAVSNFIQVEKQCLVAGWYISCVIQLLAIGTIIIYIYVKKPKIGVYIMVLMLIMSLTIRFAVTYHTKSYGIIKFMISSTENPLSSYEYSNLYTQIYMRGIPFYAGLLAGVAADALKQREIKISTTTTYVSTAVIIVICMYVQMYGMTFYERRRQYDAIESAIYGTLSNCTWTVIFFWIAICHTISSYGPIEKLFNNRFAVPLGRLSYSVYLVNITVMMMIENSKRTSATPTMGMLQV
ncbi:nose resistant to fluoxetine protein 6-like isoform X2 [Adelges cooleyi]|uniref:nose resistant to fluoxetine protein 6-like isoform X2 n=1 Tax=Adelges cooleyi TaxID=133065 RepID=UPI0021806133|nr:nose resistant to fluoxetine protein 6-like isoform X2 [Adelges cooleyi]